MAAELNLAPTRVGGGDWNRIIDAANRRDVERLASILVDVDVSAIAKAKVAAREKNAKDAAAAAEKAARAARTAAKKGQAEAE